jgi:hypothetical protein
MLLLFGYSDVIYTVDWVINAGAVSLKRNHLFSELNLLFLSKITDTFRRFYGGVIFIGCSDIAIDRMGFFC